VVNGYKLSYAKLFWLTLYMCSWGGV